MTKILYWIQAVVLGLMGAVRAPELDLQMFAEGGGAVVNTTEGQVNAYTGESTRGMTVAMKTYYDTELLENARDQAVYGQLGRQQALPARHGKTVEWRKWNTLPEPDQLQEGVIPAGKKFGQTALTIQIAQWGEYVTVSDQLELHSVDDVILGATEEVGAAMGKKADLLTRDAIMLGATNVLFAPALDAEGKAIYTPPAFYIMSADEEAFCKFTPSLVAMAVTQLKKANAPTIDGKYVAVIHPSVAYDLRNDPAWISYHQYDASREIFTGEIGELHGVRFVESNTAPVLVGKPLYNEWQRYLTLTTAATASPGIPMTYGVTGALTFTVSEDLDGAGCTTDWESMVDQMLLLSDGGVVTYQMLITGVSPETNQISVLGGPTTFTVAAGADFLLPGNGGAETKEDNEPVAVYCTMFFGQDAFGVVAPEGAGMEMIIKPKEEAGGPLNQFSTIGGKMSHAATILYPERVLAVFSTSSFSDTDEANWEM